MVGYDFNGAYSFDGAYNWGPLTEVLDDFDDGSLSEWVGATGQWTHDSTATAYDGTSIRQANTSSGSDSINNQNITTQQGETYGWRTRIGANSVPNGNTFFCWAVSVPGTNGDMFGGWDCYTAKVSYENSNFALERFDASTGGAGATLDTDATTPPTDDWLEGEVVWNGDGSMTVTFWDSTGTQVAQLSGTDTTYTTGGLGLSTDDDANAINQWFDHIVRK